MARDRGTLSLARLRKLLSSSPASNSARMTRGLAPRRAASVYAVAMMDSFMPPAVAGGVLVHAFAGEPAVSRTTVNMGTARAPSAPLTATVPLTRCSYGRSSTAHCRDRLLGQQDRSDPQRGAGVAAAGDPGQQLGLGEPPAAAYFARRYVGIGAAQPKQ